MKKILVYVDSMNPAGGIERVISNLSNEWIKNNEVVILVKDDGKSFYNLNENIKIISIQNPLKINMNSKINRIFNFIKSIIKSHYSIKKVINSEKPDFIYTAYTINSLEIYLLGKKLRDKLIISEHGSKFAYNKVHNIIKKIVYPKAYVISVPTKMDTEEYKKEGFPAVYMPHINTFKSEEVSELNNKIVLNVGRMTADKQQIKLLNIWNELYKKNKLDGWKLRIVGRGEEKNKLEQYISDNNMKQCVELMDPTNNIKEVFKSSSVFAFTSKFEGFGMVLLEAMTMGVPCVSFDCPSGPRDIIVNEKNGFIVEKDNLKDFENKLYKLISDEKLRKKMGNESFKTAINWNNTDIMKIWDNIFMKSK